MTTTPPNTSKLNKTLLIVAGVILALVVITAAAVMTNPELLAGTQGSLPGTAFGPNGYYFRPKHVGEVDLELAEVPWEIPGGGHYVVLWCHDTTNLDGREWFFEPLAGSTAQQRIYSRQTKEKTANSISYTKRYLAVRDASKDEGADVITFPDAGGNNHLWQIKLIIQKDKETGFDYYQIKNVNSGLCLAIRDAAKTEGAALIQTKCVDPTPDIKVPDSQLWRLFL